jgi:hypothetical protein
MMDRARPTVASAIRLRATVSASSALSKAILAPANWTSAAAIAAACHPTSASTSGSGVVLLLLPSNELPGDLGFVSAA